MLTALIRDDLAEVMRIERLPGYDAFVGRWELDVHQAELTSDDARYFAWREAGALTGFTILQAFRQPVVRLRRIAVAAPGGGTGTLLMRAVLDRVFETTPAIAVDLHVKTDNLRALAVYRREGFVPEGEGEGDDHERMLLTRGAWAALPRHAA